MFEIFLIGTSSIVIRSLVVTFLYFVFLNFRFGGRRIKSVISSVQMLFEESKLELEAFPVERGVFGTLCLVRPYFEAPASFNEFF
jgi:hypothetical protein